MCIRDRNIPDYGERDDCSADNLLNVGINRHQVHDISQEANHKRTDYGSPWGADTAREAGAADDGSCQPIHLISGSSRGKSAVYTGHEEDCRDTYQNTVEDIGCLLYTSLEDVPQTRRDYKRSMQLKNVLDFIDNNYALPITLEQLSAAASMSPKYFCRFFYQMTHRTPIDYLNYQRIEHACYELATSENSVTDVAFNCGFNDLSYFIKTFKRYKGKTPGKYHA